MLAEPFLRGNKLTGVWDWSGYGRRGRDFMQAAEGWDQAASWSG